MELQLLITTSNIMTIKNISIIIDGRDSAHSTKGITVRQIEGILKKEEKTPTV